MGAFWSSKASEPAPAPAGVQPHSRKLDNLLSSRLIQLPSDLQAKVVSSLLPMSVTNTSLLSLGACCSALQAMSHFSTALDVSSRMFADVSRAKSYLARFEGLLSLKVTAKCDCVMPRLDMNALQINSIVSRLQHLELTGCQSLLTQEDCEVITGLTSLKTLSIRGFTVVVLDLSPSVTDVTVSHCILTTNKITGVGIQRFKMSDCTPPNQRLDLRCMPAVRKLYTGECFGELQLSLPSVLQILRSTMHVAGDVLSQLTCMTALKCQTQSQVVDLRVCSQLYVLSVSGDRLVHLDVSDCKHLTFMKAWGSQLNDLRVRGCTQLFKCDLTGCALRRQPFQPGTEWNLENLHLRANRRLTNVSDLPPSLVKLDLCACKNLVVIPRLLLPCLIQLDVSDCSRLSELDITGFSRLVVLRRNSCPNLLAVNGIENCAAIVKAGKRAGLSCQHQSKPNSKYCGIHRFRLLNPEP